MLCNFCKKTEANVHLTEIINKKIAKLHICETCAKEKGLELPFIKTHSSLAEFVTGFAELTEPDEIKLPYRKLSCKNCGSSYASFISSGLFGCSNCYSSFSKHLFPLLKRIHSANRHTGKRPKTLVPYISVMRLKQELASAIKKEEYERAAKLRDQINELEGLKLNAIR